MDVSSCRYMGTITGISDLDPVRWKNSQWRNLQVGQMKNLMEVTYVIFHSSSPSRLFYTLHILKQVAWDESAAGERRNRVSLWDIEPVAAPFFICPPPFFRSKRPRQPGMPG